MYRRTPYGRETRNHTKVVVRRHLQGAGWRDLGRGWSIAEGLSTHQTNQWREFTRVCQREERSTEHRRLKLVLAVLRRCRSTSGSVFDQWGHGRGIARRSQFSSSAARPRDVPFDLDGDECQCVADALWGALPEARTRPKKKRS